ncbi:MAG: hypothetical protein C5B50_21720 [Verrucomicrobia bacterium]|nr:MAG: hypothetical protein C5B50_21720 [Verrucomicrobiota bacterium]
MRIRKLKFAICNLQFVVPLAFASLMLVQSARAQTPANDDFAGAIAITGTRGTTTGNNVGATTETGECLWQTIYPDNCQTPPGGASVWWKWICPQTGPYSFDTEGSDFDTMLGVYTGTSVGALVPMSENDDINYPIDANSRVIFNAIQGTVYYIAVDGFDPEFDPAGSTGDIVLNWHPSGGAGDFNFTSGLYLCSEFESFGARNGFMNPATYLGARLTITRTNGSTGKVLVDYMVTNTLYTNFINVSILGMHAVGPFTNAGNVVMSNYFNTNIVYTYKYQTCEYGEFTYLPPIVNFTNIFITNVPPFVQTPTILFTNDMATNIPAFTVPCFGLGFTNLPPDTNGNIGSFSCTNYVITNIVGSATPFVDYVPVQGTLIFSNYQMAADIPVTVLPSGQARSATNLIVNHAVIAVIPQLALVSDPSGQTPNPYLDPIESQDIIPPRSDGFTNTLLNVLDDTAMTYLANPPAFVDSTQGGFWNCSQCRYVPPDDPHDPNWWFRGRFGLTNIINLERSTLRCNKIVNGQIFAHVAVLRFGANASQAVSVGYRISYLYPLNNFNHFFRDIFGNGDGPDRLNPCVGLQAGSDYAVPPSPFAGQGLLANNNNGLYGSPPDFGVDGNGQVEGTINFPPFNNIQFIDFPINDWHTVDFNKDLMVEIFVPPATPPQGQVDVNPFIGFVRTCALTILFNNVDNTLGSPVEPAGALDRTHNVDNDPGTDPPYNPHPGANSTVYDVKVQPDGSTVFAGDFTAFNAFPINRICRMLTNGQRDHSFNPGDGADQFISSIALDPTNNIIVGGAFNSINRIVRNKLARLTSSGGLDTSFNPGLGANGTVWKVRLQSDGKIVIAGEFTSFNTTNRNRIARINPDGSLDASFNPGIGPNGPIYDFAIQGDGKIVIGGQFSTVDTTNRSCIARLNADGTFDPSFNPRSAAGGDNPVVYSVALQGSSLLVGGSFSAMYGVARNNFARLNTDGSLDFNFNPGDGPDAAVYGIVVNQDGTIVITGAFRNVNQTRRAGIGRLYGDGTVDTSFMDTAYNQFAGLPTPYFQPSDPTVQEQAVILANDREPGGNIIIGGQFLEVGGGFTRDDIRKRQNIARIIGGATPGPGTIALTLPTDSANDYDQTHFIQMIRTNGFAFGTNNLLGPASVTISPVTLPAGPGSAIEGQDFTLTPGVGVGFWNAQPTWQSSYPSTWQLKDGTDGPNQGWPQNPGFQGTVWLGHWIGDPLNKCSVTILQSTNLGDKYLNFQLSNPGDNDQFLLGGQRIPLGVALGNSVSQFEIVDSHRNHGVFNFSAPTYFVAEGATAMIPIIRRDGSAGQVTVTYTAGGPGSTATNISQFFGVTNSLVFGESITNLSFPVVTRNNSVAEGEAVVSLTITNPTGGAVLGTLTNALLSIVDTNCNKGGGVIRFSTNSGLVSVSVASFGANESDGFAYIAIERHTCGAGTLAVTFSTLDGTALNGIHYLGLTNRLTWNNGDVQPKIIPIAVFDDNIVETSNLTVNLLLRDASLNGLTNNALYLGSISNAVLSITNTDSLGTLAFSAASYDVNENGGFAIIPVVRSGGAAGTISVQFAAQQGTALPNTDFIPTNGTMVFGPGELSKVFTVPIVDQPYPQLPRFVSLTLNNAFPSTALTNPNVAQLNIIDEHVFNQPPGSLDTTADGGFGFNGPIYALALQPDGRILAGGDFTEANGVPRNRLARLNPDASLDQGFSSVSTSMGANDQVLAIVAQSDQRILVGGRFTVFNGVNRFYLARLTAGGQTDTSFNPGSGPDNTVFTLAETFVGTDRKLLVGGQFTSINTLSGANLARLNDDGSVDLSYAATVNGTVYALAVQPDGKAVIGGDFTQVNGSSRNRIARLNPDGTLDAGFHPSSGANDSVRAIAIQLDGRILIGGSFTNVNGTGFNHVARLTAGGALDTSFHPGVGADDVVSSISLQGDTRIILGGQFTTCSGVTRNRITRLNNDGTVDPTINFGLGANSFVAATLVQPADGKILLGGGFTQYDTRPAQYMARIFGGSEVGSGTFEFDSATYEADEVATNALITVRRFGGTSGSDLGANVSLLFNTSDGTAHASTNYVAVSTNLIFPPGEILRTVAVPVLHDFTITPDLTVNLALSNPSPIHSPSISTDPALGNQPTATLTIFNDDSGISFSSAAYSAPENAPSGTAVIPIVRTGSLRLSASVDFMTTTNGTAVTNVDYLPVGPITFPFAPGQGSNFVAIPVLHEPNVYGPNTVGLELTNALGALLFSPSQATLTILEVDNLNGQLLFAQTNLLVNEGDGFAYVSVLRTNGYAGIVTASYSTVPGTAAPGVNYVQTNGVVAFADGQTNAIIAVPIIQKTYFQGNTTFAVALSSPTGGASIIGPTSNNITIVDNHVGVAFSSPIYIASETNGSLIVAVNRFGTNGTTTVQYFTSDGSALAGTNYQSVNGLLTFNPGEFLKTFPVSLLYDPRVTGSLFFNLNLTNATGGAQIYANNPATVDLLDADPGISFTNATFSVLKSGTNVLISVLRSNANTGFVTVGYATTNGTAIAGVDYVSTFGTLTFSNGVDLQSFTVPIINNGQVEGDRTFNIGLFNPSPPAQLVPPSSASVTITDNVAAISFSAPAYVHTESPNQAIIQVFRSGYTNQTNSVDFATADGTGINNVNYLSTNGTLVFYPGDTVKVFSVFAVDDTLVTGDKTVLLHLSNPSGASVITPNHDATLTFLESDGSLIQPAGTLMTYESGPANGVIDPGETVTLQLALHVAAGTNTANLIATLLTTNGVTSPSGPQTYGLLTVDGPSVYKPFTFTASGTNGQSIAVTLRLQDGAAINQVVFPFVLGQAVTGFTNAAQININDNTNATPYPSIINVNGLIGSVGKVSVVLTNFTHTWPRDVDVLLSSPSGQQSYLMAKAGGSIAVHNVTLTFDDAAANSLSISNALTSGTWLPTSYAVVPPPFPLPAPPPPYYTNLSLFNGSNPNGNWSLFVLDDTPSHSGAISNGWVLTFTSINAVPANADVGIAMSAAVPSPLVVLSNQTYAIAVTNYGPASATNVVVTDNLPATGSYISSLPSTGSVTTNGSGLVTWTVGTLGNGGFATLSLSMRANSIGSITNLASVTTSSTDLNTNDDFAAVATTVVSQTADLSIAALSASPPNPAWAASPVTYSITVSNAGPATAAAATLTDTLPGSFVFDSASAPFTLTGNVLVLTLGSIGSGSQSSATIQLTPTAAGTFTNSVSTTSLTVDPAKANNSAAIKTIVQALQLSVAATAGHNLVFSWPTNPPGSYLEYSTDLRPTIVWTRLLTPPQSLLNSQWTVTVGATNGPRFFRVHAP